MSGLIPAFPSEASGAGSKFPEAVPANPLGCLTGAKV